MDALLAYDPARLRALALRTAAAIQWLDARNSAEPTAQDAVATIRLISHTLSTTWMPRFSSVLGDTSMTGWDSGGPVVAGPAAHGFAGGVAGAASQLDTDPNFDLSDAVSLGGDGTINWDDAINPGCVTFAGGGYGGGGFVTGPDGREYPIVIPGVPSDGGVYTADIGPLDAGDPCVGNLNGSDDGWTPIGYQSGIERFQASPSWAERTLGFFAGTTGLVTALPPSSGLQFIQMRPNSMPALATTPAASPPPIGSSEPGLTDLVETPAAQAGLDLAVEASDGWVFATNMDNQRERAYQVIYEQNDDNRIRARIQTYTLAQDGDGDIVIVPEDVWVNPEGALMSQLTTYAPPDGSSGVWTSVSDVALSPGTTPVAYSVTQAVFP